MLLAVADPTAAVTPLSLAVGVEGAGASVPRAVALGKLATATGLDVVVGWTDDSVQPASASTRTIASSKDTSLKSASGRRFVRAAARNDAVIPQRDLRMGRATEVK